MPLVNASDGARIFSEILYGAATFAAFLVLLRKGGSIRVGESLAPWLYVVAYRTAQRARAVASRYHPFSNNSLDKVQPGWMRFELSPGTTATPVFGGDEIAALAIKGKTIDQIAVFSPQRGVWVKQRLLRPVEGEIYPFIFGEFVLYQAGNDFYVLTKKRLWFQVLHLEGAEPVSACGRHDGHRGDAGKPALCLQPKNGGMVYGRRDPLAAHRCHP